MLFTRIESIKTTSMEDVSTRVFEKIKLNMALKCMARQMQPKSRRFKSSKIELWKYYSTKIFSTHGLSSQRTGSIPSEGHKQTLHQICSLATKQQNTNHIKNFFIANKTVDQHNTRQNHNLHTKQKKWQTLNEVPWSKYMECSVWYNT